MLLPELRAGISGAMARMSGSADINANVVATFVDDISLALTQAGVPPEMVRGVKTKLVAIINMDCRASRRKKLLSLQQGVFNVLVELFSCRTSAVTPEKGKPCVVLLIGLEGSGKEVTAYKYANYHKLRGYMPAVICAKRWGPGVFEKLRQCTRNARIPCHGCDHSFDGVQIATAGLRKFKKTNTDLIVVDTHAQYNDDAELIKHMIRIAEATRPDIVIFTIDGTIGYEAVLAHAAKFKENAPRAAPCGAIILTKMDGNANGGGALCATAVANMPLIFTEHNHKELELYDVKMSVTHLLGLNSRILEIQTQDFLDVILTAGATEVEEKSMLEAFRSSCLDEQARRVSQYKLLADQILSLQVECDAVCDLLGDQKFKNKKINASSLEDRYKRMITFKKQLDDTKEERMQKIRALQLEGHDLSQFFGAISEIHEFEFMKKKSTVSLQEVVKDNGLSTGFLKRVESKINEMKKLKSIRMAKIAEKIAELDNCHQKEPYLITLKDHQPDFTIDDVRNGRVEFTVAVNHLEALIHKAKRAHLIRKLILSQSEDLLNSSLDGTDLYKIRALIDRVQKWESQYNTELQYYNKESVRSMLSQAENYLAKTRDATELLIDDASEFVMPERYSANAGLDKMEK